MNVKLNEIILKKELLNFQASNNDLEISVVNEPKENKDDILMNDCIENLLSNIDETPYTFLSNDAGSYIIYIFYVFNNQRSSKYFY